MEQDSFYVLLSPSSVPGVPVSNFLSLQLGNVFPVYRSVLSLVNFGCVFYMSLSLLLSDSLHSSSP